MPISLIMTFLILILMAVITGVLMLRLRVRYVNVSDQHTLFVGLGRTGLLMDFKNRINKTMLLGRRIKSSLMDQQTPKPKKASDKSRRKKKRPKSRRRRSLSDMVRVATNSRKALWSYVIGLLRSVIVEDLKASIQGGFDSVDLTGQIFGYYQAALGAVPAVVGRVQFTPDWTGASFDASGRASLALPMYHLVGKTIRLIVNLPLREIIKMAIGKK